MGHTDTTFSHTLRLFQGPIPVSRSAPHEPATGMKSVPRFSSKIGGDTQIASVESSTNSHDVRVTLTQEKGDWLRVFEGPVPFSSAHPAETIFRRTGYDLGGIHLHDLD